MKKITTLLFFALLSLGLNAQSLLPIKYGIKVGTNIANISSTQNDGASPIDNSAQIGVAGGFYMEIPLNDKWYLNPELITHKKAHHLLMIIHITILLTKKMNILLLIL